MITKAVRDTDSWKTFFAHQEYMRFANAIVSPDRTRAEAAHIMRLLDLQPGARILDLGCGNGRLAIPLARAGYSVTGLDACEELLSIARNSAVEVGGELSFIHAEMKDFASSARYDAVINIGTAFGYVPCAKDDQAALRNACRSLAPGGAFLIETENRDHRVRTSRRTWFRLADTTVWSDRDYDPLTGRWHERIEWLVGGVVHRTEYSVRLYSLTELAAMLSDAGFEVAGAWGDLAGASYDLDSPRMVVMARRPNTRSEGRVN
jgi:SAM-dependent methyltransferase